MLRAVENLWKSLWENWGKGVEKSAAVEKLLKKLCVNLWENCVKVLHMVSDFGKFWGDCEKVEKFYRWISTCFSGCFSLFGRRFYTFST